MALKKSIFVLAFFITLFLFLSILVLGNFLGDQRQAIIDKDTQQTYNSLNEMQTFSMMADTYGSQMACLAFSSKLQDLDKDLWNLGLKLDQYRAASEEFRTDPYYQQQKATFNDNEVMYLVLLRKLKETCNYNQAIVLFFYRNSNVCTKCDDQSFVLTDINLLVQKEPSKEVSIFSFDADLNITSINLLEKYYNISEYPCTVVEDKVFCGMQDKSFVLKQICSAGPSLSICNNSSN